MNILGTKPGWNIKIVSNWQKNVSSLSEIMTKKKDFMSFAFIVRYWHPLLPKKKESQVTEKEEKHGYDTDRYFDTRPRRRIADLASQ